MPSNEVTSDMNQGFKLGPHLIQEDYFSEVSASVNEESHTQREDQPSAPVNNKFSLSQKVRKWMRLSKKTLLYLKSLANTVYDLLRHYASWVSFLEHFISFTLKGAFALMIAITNFISPISRIINGISLLHNVIFYLEGKWTRRLSFVAALGSLGLGIAAIILTPFVLIFATANIAINTVLGFWSLSIMIKSRFWGNWKEERNKRYSEEEEFYTKLSDKDLLEKYVAFKNKEPHQSIYPSSTIDDLLDLEHSILQRKNQERKFKVALGIQAYKTTLLCLALAGIILTFFPPTLIIGASILFGTFLGGILTDHDLLNKWFQVPLAGDSIEELRIKVAAHKQRQLSSTADIELNLQISQEKPGLSPKEVDTAKEEISQEISTSSNAPLLSPSNMFKRRSNTAAPQVSALPQPYLDVMPTIR